MKRTLCFVFIIVFVFMIDSTIFAEEYPKFKSGDIVRYNDIAFYVLFDSDSNEDSVQLVKMVPLTHEEINHYTEGKAIKINPVEYIESLESLRNLSIPYGNMAYYYGDDCYGCRYAGINGCRNSVETGCLSDYEISNVKKVVDDWTLDNFNEDDIVIDEYGYKSRLLKVKEYLTFDSQLVYLENMDRYNLVNLPKWLTTINYYSWTIDERITTHCSSGNNNCHDDLEVYINDCYNLTYSPTFYSGSVRPTITLKKSSISKVSFNEYHNNQVREYKIGDIINYNDTQFYVIKNSSINDNTVTLLKNSPLTKYELEKYGEGYINNYINEYYADYRKVEPGKVIIDDERYKVAYLSTDKCYEYYEGRIYYSNYLYNSSGCNQNYDTSNVKHIVDNWQNNIISEDDIIEDHSGYKARLINVDDLTDLGYISIVANTNDNDNFKVGNDTPEFMFNDNTRGMLTMIPSYTYTYYNGEISYGMAVADDGYRFVGKWIPNGAIGTVRPVVTLNKKEITPKITNVEEIEDTVSSDNDSNNKEVTIETEVDNDNIEIDNVNNIKNSLSVLVPNTLSNKRLLLIIVGVVISIISSLIFLYIKNKK